MDNSKQGAQDIELFYRSDDESEKGFMGTDWEEYRRPLYQIWFIRSGTPTSLRATEEQTITVSTNEDKYVDSGDRTSQESHTLTNRYLFIYFFYRLNFVFINSLNRNNMTKMS